MKVKSNFILNEPFCEYQVYVRAQGRWGGRGGGGDLLLAKPFLEYLDQTPVRVPQRECVSEAVNA